VGINVPRTGSEIPYILAGTDLGGLCQSGEQDLAVQTIQGLIAGNLHFPWPSNLLQTVLLPTLADICVLNVVRDGELNTIGLGVCLQQAFGATYAAFVELYPLCILSAFQDWEDMEKVAS
jgi:hypothetical protein